MHFKQLFDTQDVILITQAETNSILSLSNIYNRFSIQDFKIRTLIPCFLRLEGESGDSPGRAAEGGAQQVTGTIQLRWKTVAEVQAVQVILQRTRISPQGFYSIVRTSQWMRIMKLKKPCIFTRS